LVRAARQLVAQRDVTELSNRDRDRFLAFVDDTTKKPNKALPDAAARYRKLAASHDAPWVIERLAKSHDRAG
jgi:uncharacterized protein (DUF1778 family)